MNVSRYERAYSFFKSYLSFVFNRKQNVLYLHIKSKEVFVYFIKMMEMEVLEMIQTIQLDFVLNPKTNIQLNIGIETIQSMFLKT